MSSQKTQNIPLAERMRPTQIEDFVGQEELLGEGRILNKLFQQKKIPSLLLWGPPGTGKTTLAHILAQNISADFVFFSAVLSGVKEVRKIVTQATEQKDTANIQTILFVDEIHRFNKAQQDAFLPHVESGLFTLIGATTENPSFQVIAPLLSRCRVLVLKPLTTDELKIILKHALEDQKNGLGKNKLKIEEKALNHICNLADGDARVGLNILEVAADLAEQNDDNEEYLSITMHAAEEASQDKFTIYVWSQLEATQKLTFTPESALKRKVTGRSKEKPKVAAIPKDVPISRVSLRKQPTQISNHT